MRFSKVPLAAALVLSVLCVAAPSLAQAERDERGYGYRFDDDYMVGETLSTTPPLLKGFERRLRITLIRPRASFVPEMLKSVEAM